MKNNESQTPLAIVGIGCRFPGGANSPQEYWKLITEKVDAVDEIPANRWDADRWFHPDPDCPGRTYSRWAGCLNDVTGFDASFFGISPREAANIDPQQRILLEIVWETLEDANVLPSDLARTNTGVFIGVCGHEYALLQAKIGCKLTSTSILGSTTSIAANRISYIYDFHGPSYSVDTACSSSLVAIDAACKSVWSGDADVALAGGVNVLCAAHMGVGFSRAKMLSPTGRCRPFDVAADGYVRAEGAGMVLIKPLASAITDGDRIYALIAGTGVNQDGRTSGIAMPSANAQSSLLKEVLAQTGIHANQIQFVEAHGTGTRIGDPIECRGLGKALSSGGLREIACRIGSIKSNIGHLEGASGIAGLIKAALAIHHRTLPPQAGFQEPNPRIPFEKLNLLVQQEVEPWPVGSPERIAAVNSFGFGGTNANAILKEYQPDGSDASAITGNVHIEDQTEVVVIRARDPESLKKNAAKYQKLIEQGTVSLRDVSHAAARNRSDHAHRLAVVGSSLEDIEASLDAYLAGEKDKHVFDGVAAAETPKIGFVFSGNGTQWWGMARQLFANEPVFREAVQRCDLEFAKYGDASLIKELHKSEADSRMPHTEVAQPALFAVQMGLVDLLKEWGIEPSIVFGHSVGEVSAAAVAGILDFESAVRVLFQRSRVQAKTFQCGTMAAVNLPEHELREILHKYQGKLEIAAVNSRNSVTISGDANAVDELVSVLQSREIYCQKLRLDYPFHNSILETYRGEFLDSLDGLVMHKPVLPFLSTVTVELHEENTLGTDYWWDNLRHPVQFAAACDTLAERNLDAVVEIGPHPVVGGYLSQAIAEKRKSTTVLTTLRRYGVDRENLLDLTGKLYAQGQSICWDSIYSEKGPRVDLPSYSWHHEKYWNVPEEPRQQHSLLGCPLESSGHCWEQELNVPYAPYLRDHQFEGAIVYPAAAFVEMALAAGNVLYGDEAVCIDHFDIHRVFTLDETTTYHLQFHLDGNGSFNIFSRTFLNEGEWQCHASGLLRAADTISPEGVEIGALIDRCGRSRDVDEIYRNASVRGLNYGEAFRAIRELWSGDDGVVAKVSVSESVRDDALAYQIHPTVLDACFQSVLGLLEDELHEEPTAWLPARIERFRLFSKCPETVYCHISEVSYSDRFLAISACIYGEDGMVVAEIDRLCFHQVSLGRVRDTQLQYQLEWIDEVTTSENEDHTSENTPDAEHTTSDGVTADETNSESLHVDAAESGHWLLFADERGQAEELAALLRDHHQDTHLVRSAAAFEELGDNRYGARLNEQKDLVALLQSLQLKVENLRGVVFLSGLDAPPPENTDAFPFTIDQCCVLMNLARASGETGFDCGRLWVVTEQSLDIDPARGRRALSQAPLWGMARVVRNEWPASRCTVVAFDTGDFNVAARLAEELIRNAPNAEVLLHGGGRSIRQINHIDEAYELAPWAEGVQFRLELERPGHLNELCFRRTTMAELGPHSVEIEVASAGLNFKDVMWALGMLPGELMAESFSGPCFGFECAGTVTAVGQDVTNVQPGDEVIAFAPHAFARYATTLDRAVFLKPKSLSFDEAATLPVVFLTADYALNELARVQPGESVLIHGAAGGVGLAAIQIVRAAGGVVFATAGTEEKRAYLNSIGVDHVFDSRSLSFADAIRATTDDAGVDVVLNSLAGSAMEESIALLKPFGRFLEIGKRDMLENHPLPMRILQKNVSYFTIDADELLKCRSAVAAPVFERIMSRLDNEQYSPLRHRVFPASQAAEAFRFMQRSEHIGKVVLSMNDETLKVKSAQPTIPKMRHDGTYVIFGGLGGLGRSLARWYAENGARNIVLVGRSEPSATASNEIEQLRKDGIDVHVALADIANSEQLRATLEEVRATMPPIRGLVHAAMVLDDAALMNLTAAHFQKVMPCKTLGAWNVHQHTLEDPLEHFVLFSSISAVIGSPGQANYAAANTFLDELAAYRREQLGLPALSVNWGLFAETGYAAEQEGLIERLGRSGVRALRPKQAFRVMGHLLNGPKHQMSVCDVNWNRWQQLVRTKDQSLWSHLVDRSAFADDEEDSFTALLEITPESEWPELFKRRLAQHFATVIGLDVSRVETDRPVIELGIDSLMAVELRTITENDVGVELNLMTLLSGATIESLAESLLNAYRGDERSTEKIEQSLGDAEEDAATVEVDETSPSLTNPL